MLFFTRAFLCIGTIVVLAEGLGPTAIATRSRDTADAVAEKAASQLSGFCRTRPKDCLDLIGTAASGLGQQVSGGIPTAIGSREHPGARQARTDLSLRAPPPR